MARKLKSPIKAKISREREEINIFMPANLSATIRKRKMKTKLRTFRAEAQKGGNEVEDFKNTKKAPKNERIERNKPKY